jgi:lipopolysaccharide cholinephosphotransferase
MRTIDIDECHRILLSIAAELDKICRKHQIPCYMIGGTMLGAIRHKGFIPWDDDMDFGVPRAHYARLKAILSKELPPDFRLLSLNRADLVISNFLKIDNLHTQIVDSWLDKTVRLGINIDIFPLDNGLKTRFGTFLFVFCIAFLMRIKNYLYYDPDKRNRFKKQIARWTGILFPLDMDKLLKYIDRCIRRHTHPHSEFYVNYYGRWGRKEVIRKEHFGTPREYDFEAAKFYGVAHPEVYLTRLYGNYMQLPPEEKQVIHAVEMYYLDSSDSR